MPPDDRDALRKALKTVASALKAGGVRFALAGSYALWVHGAAETTHDVDFVVAEADVEHAVEVLRSAGLPVERPAEDWLVKTYVDGVLVDILHRQAGIEVTAEELDRAAVFEVLAIRMPVLSATDLMSAKLRVMNEHYCDFGAVLPAARAVREQLDWSALAAAATGNPFAEAFLFLCERLGISRND